MAVRRSSQNLAVWIRREAVPLTLLSAGCLLVLTRSRASLGTLSSGTEYLKIGTEAGQKIINATLRPAPGAPASGAFVGASVGVAAAALAIGLILNRKGPWQRVEATKLVDALEPQLRANREAYLGGPRTRADQAAALRAFDDAWGWLVSSQGLGNPALGKPGKVGISDRSRGGRWDWFAYYRDPIAQDTPTDAAPGISLLSNGLSAGAVVGVMLLALATAF